MEWILDKILFKISKVIITSRKDTEAVAPSDILASANEKGSQQTTMKDKAILLV